MKACFASEMRGVDKAASEIGGIPSIVLMENAAMACVEELKNDFANTEALQLNFQTQRTRLKNLRLLNSKTVSLHDRLSFILQCTACQNTMKLTRHFLLQ